MLRFNEARTLAIGCRHGEPSISAARASNRNDPLLSPRRTALEEARARMAPTCFRAVVAKLDLRNHQPAFRNCLENEVLHEHRTAAALI